MSEASRTWPEPQGELLPREQPWSVIREEPIPDEGGIGVTNITRSLYEEREWGSWAKEENERIVSEQIDRREID